MWLIDRSRFIFDTVREQSVLAKKDTGKGIASQITEMIALRYGDGKLSPDEYYQYCLYDDKKYSWREKKTFLGRTMEERLIPILRAQRWVDIAHDKLISCGVFAALGFPTPAIYAVYHRARSFGSVPVLREPHALAEFIRIKLNPPFIAKPVNGMWGKNVWAVANFDSKNDRVILKNQQQIELETFVDRLNGPRGEGLLQGVLLQELLEAHPRIQAWCGERVCSVRMVVIMDHRGARLIATLWKIATGASMADNYWEPGNMVALVDQQTGRVGRPFSGLGRNIAYIDQHPDTGQTLTGVILPDWQAATELCLSAAATLPGIPMQAWDIALTSKGPVLIEVNVNGGMRLPQLVKQDGLYHGELRELLKQFGYPKRRFLGKLLGARGS